MLAQALPIDLEKKKDYRVPVSDTALIGFGSPETQGGQAATSLRLFFRPSSWHCSLRAGHVGQRKLRLFLVPGLPTRMVSPTRLEAGERGLSPAHKEAIMPKTMYRALRALFPIQSHPIASTPSLNEARLLGARLVNAGARVVIHRAKDGFIVRGVA